MKAASGSSVAPLAVDHGGSSHSAGLVCDLCPADLWPAHSRRYVAELHARIDAALALCDKYQGSDMALESWVNVAELRRALTAAAEPVQP